MEQAVQDCKIVVSLNASAKTRGIIVLFTFDEWNTNTNFNTRYLMISVN